MQTKELILKQMDLYVNNWNGLRERWEKKLGTDVVTKNRLYNIQLGKIVGMLQLMDALGMEEEAKEYEWVSKFGI